MCLAIAAALIAVLITGCNGDGEDPMPTEPPGLTLLLQGTTRAACTGDSHALDGSGNLVIVTLIQSTSNTPLMVQMCATGTNSNCSVPLQKIDPSSSVTGSLRGGTAQTLKFVPLNCGGPGPAPASDVSYIAHAVFF